MSRLRKLTRRRNPAKDERRSEVAARFKKQRTVTKTTTVEHVPVVKVDTPEPVPGGEPRKGLAAGEATTAAVQVIKEAAEELVLPAFLAFPSAATMRSIVAFVTEGLVRLVRLREGKDIRASIGKVYAYASIAASMAQGLRLLHTHLVENKHDPQVVEAVSEFASAARRLAAIGEEAASKTAKRYRGTASDQARGVQLPDLHD